MLEEQFPPAQIAGFPSQSSPSSSALAQSRWSSQSQASTPTKRAQGPSEQGLQHSPCICPLAKAQPSYRIFYPVTRTMTRTSKQWEGSEPTSSYLSKAIKLQGRHCRAPRVSLHILTVQATQSSAKSTHAFLIAPKNNHNIKMTSRQPPSPALPTSINQLAKQILLFCYI